MKKLLLILMVLGVTAPLFAQGWIEFSVVDNQNGSCTITYDANDVLGIAPVAMGLKVKVTSGNPIKSVVLEDPCDFMEIFMDAAYSMEDPCGDPCTNYTYGAGTPIADPCNRPGEVSLTTHGNHFVLSFGGLGGEFEKTKPAPMLGTITLYADTQEAPTGPGGVVTGTIKLDVTRGGVIGDDGMAMGTNLDDPAKAGPMAFSISECMPIGATTAVQSPLLDAPEENASTTHAEWSTAGKPVCWCYVAQCHGNADGVTNGSPKGGYWRVGSEDLNILAAGFGKKEPPDDVGAANIYYNHPQIGLIASICANSNRMLNGSTKGGYWAVGSNDLNRLAASFLIKDPGVPLTDCGGSIDNTPAP